MSDKDLQFEEILAIKSIYEESDLLVFDENTNKGTFYAKIVTCKPLKINFINENEQITVEYLPPFALSFEFPTDYPSVNPPKYTLGCKWLSNDQLSKLCDKLDDLWDKSMNCSILFTWISFLIDESLDYLEFTDNTIELNTKDSENMDKRSLKEPCSIHLLRDYDKDESEAKFKSSMNHCDVCFTDKYGSECIRFVNCNHVYCCECMRGHFETQIKDGNVNGLTCPYSKCETQALPLQVMKLVDKEIYERYEFLQLRNSLNNMCDIVYCPRMDCQKPVLTEENSNLARCSNTRCLFVFCSMCRQNYHGVEPCKIKNEELKKICMAYKHGDIKTREDLAKRYGLQRIKHALEEYSSMELISNTSKQCPKCKSWMQKLDGCNKMTCIKCQAYFCWLCMGILSKTDPYSHYSTSSSGCFERLFEGIDTRDEQNDLDNDSSDEDFDSDDDHDDEDDDILVDFDTEDEEIEFIRNI